MGLALFRGEALRARNASWLGTINIATPPSIRVIAGLSLAIVVIACLFLVFGQYTRRERVVGQLVPTNGVLNVSGMSAGVIARSYVREGQTVKRGDPLVQVSLDVSSNVYGDTHALVSSQLRLQRLKLQGALADKEQLLEEQLRGLQSQLTFLHVQVQEFDSQIALQNERVGSVRTRFGKIKPLLESGYVSALQVDQLESALLDAMISLKTMQRQRLEAEQKISGLEQDRRQAPLIQTAQVSELQRVISDIDQQLARNEAQREIVHRAAEDGVVANVLVKDGQSVAAGQSLLTILPHDSRLRAQLLLPSRAVGFIQNGQDVVIRYHAYPYQKFGQQAGSVAEISMNALGPAEVTHMTGVPSGESSEPLYRIIVALDSQTLMVYGQPRPLRSGMLLEADILLDRRRLIEWMFGPLLGLRQRIGAQGDAS